MKLWFFRTPGGFYGLSPRRPKKGDYAMIDCGYSLSCWMIFSNVRHPRGFSKLAKGSCVPVTLRAEGE